MENKIKITIEPKDACTEACTEGATEKCILTLKEEKENIVCSVHTMKTGKRLLFINNKSSAAAAIIFNRTDSSYEIKKTKVTEKRVTFVEEKIITELPRNCNITITI